jgi:hypothetical protein
MLGLPAQPTDAANKRRGRAMRGNKYNIKYMIINNILCFGRNAASSLARRRIAALLKSQATRMRMPDERSRIT